MWPLPYPDYSDGKGPSVRPTLEVLSDGEPAWVLWPGKWGSSDSSPTGPRIRGNGGPRRRFTSSAAVRRAVV